MFFLLSRNRWRIITADAASSDLLFFMRVSFAIIPASASWVVNVSSSKAVLLLKTCRTSSANS